jgi:hypothetical protein
VRPGARPLRAVGALAALTLLTTTVSESIFWGQPDQAYGDPFGLLATLLAYGVVVVAVVGLLERIAPSTWLGVFLGGALLGWTIEGIVVTTTYEALPFSISFTGLAWHALISVAWAWVLLPRWLAWGRRGLVRMVVLGGLWGVWGAAQGQDSDEQASTTGFAGYAVVASVLLAAGLVGWLRWRSPRLVGGAPLVVALTLIALLALVRVVQVPWAALVLAPLLASAVWALRRLPRGTPLAVLEPAPSVRAVVIGSALMAGSAVVAYALTRATTVPDGFGPAVYLVTSAAGFGLFIRALWLALRRPSTDPVPG